MHDLLPIIHMKKRHIAAVASQLILLPIFSINIERDHSKSCHVNSAQ